MKKIKNDKIRYKLTPDEDAKKDLTWYPGHMAKAFKQVQARIKKVELVIEVRDARIPLLSGNKELHQLLGQKKKIILLNKADLADTQALKAWIKKLKNDNQECLALSATDSSDKSKIIQAIKKLISKEKIRVMIVGIPNCGKSSIINMLSGKKATRTANKPGLTTAQQWINIAENIELLDTPGIMPPRINNEQHAQYLAAIHAIPDKILGKDELAIFLINYLTKYKKEELEKFYQIKTGSHYIETLDNIAIRRGAILKNKVYDYDRVYQLIINDFRSGSIAKVSFTTP